MKIHRAHKIRLCPNGKQESYFVRACGVSRFVYNWGLSEWRRKHDVGERASPYVLKKQFNSIKKKSFPFVMEVTKCASEQAFSDLGNAFKSFFRSIKTENKIGYPKFKKRGMHDSFYLANDKIRFDGKRIFVSKLGWVKMREAVRFDGKILSATINRVADKWFVSVNIETEVSKPVPKSHVVGVDIGIKRLAATSSGEVFENPRALKNAENKIRFLQKSVSRKKKGSNNRRKAVTRLQRQHYKISCIRKDAIHKATTAITKGCSVIGIEDLNVRGMLRNRKLSKALFDASLSEFHRQLEYKAKWNGATVVKADRFYPSSKTCSSCGVIKGDLKLSDRIYSCESCGLKMDRDLNAAVNLKRMAVGSTVSACRLGSAGPERGETTDWAGISCWFAW